MSLKTNLIDRLRKLHGDADFTSYSQSDIDWLEKTLVQFGFDKINTYMYPNSNGKLRMEWDIGNRCPSVEIDFYARDIYMHWCSKDMSSYDDFSLPLHAESTWNKVIITLLMLSMEELS